MALPKLETPKYSCVLPTTNETVFFRPFLVGEQKVLLSAQESEDQNAQIREMMRLINICCDDVNVDKLPTIDLEFLFLQLRIKSVGETSSIILQCKDCKEDNTVELELEETKLVGVEEAASNIIKLTDTINIELQYPSYEMMQKMDLNVEEQNVEEMFKLVARCVVAVIDGDEIHSKDDFTNKELFTFLDSMSIDMFEKVQKFFETAPTLELRYDYECTNCKVQNSNSLTGVGNFFE
jgi:hypothetical protein